jgi:hypothetical protein
LLLLPAVAAAVAAVAAIVVAAAAKVHDTKVGRPRFQSLVTCPPWLPPAMIPTHRGSIELPLRRVPLLGLLQAKELVEVGSRIKGGLLLLSVDAAAATEPQIFSTRRQ